MSLATRLARLEAALPPKPPEPDVDAWLATVPPAVLAFLEARIGAPTPISERIWATLGDTIDSGHAPSLRMVQWEVLAEAWHRVCDAVMVERGNRYDPETCRQARERLYGADPGLSRFHAAWADRGGDTWVRLWRERHTTDPATLAFAGLGAAELALLDADEDIA